MPDLGYRIKGFGWMKDYPSIKDYGPNTVEEKLLAEKHLVKETNSAQKIKSVLQTKGTSNKRTPSKIDNKSYCSPVKDQGSLGSCTANMAASMYEYMSKRGHGNYVELSRLFIYKTTRWLMHLTGDTGAYIRSALGALVIYGAPPETYYPYNIEDFDNIPDILNTGFAQSFQVAKYFRLDKGLPSNSQLVDRMKNYIQRGFALGTGFTVFESYEQASTNGGLILYPRNEESVIGGHAITLVGYNDNKENGCFLFKNSWGLDWGDKGYGWIPYKYFIRQDENDGPLADDIWSIIKHEWIELGDFGFNSKSGDNI